MSEWVPGDGFSSVGTQTGAIILAMAYVTPLEYSYVLLKSDQQPNLVVKAILPIYGTDLMQCRTHTRVLGHQLPKCSNSIECVF